MINRENFTSIIDACLAAVKPNKLVKEAIQLSDNQLSISRGSTSIKLTVNHNVYLIAFGKAAYGMSRGAEDVLGNHLVGGIASVPFGSLEVLRRNKLEDMIPHSHSKIIYLEGAKDNLPDQASLSAARQIEDMCSKFSSDDVVIVLISGGGSALLSAPVPGINLEDKFAVIKLLSSRGANIKQLNTVRQHLSALKGGKLGSLIRPATGVSLIISDVVGNDLQFIASGPTVKLQSTRADALNILSSFCHRNEIPANVLRILTESAIDSSDNNDHILNILLGDVGLALEATKQHAEKIGFKSFIVRGDLTGFAADVGLNFARLTNYLLSDRAYFYKLSSNSADLKSVFGLLLPNSYDHQFANFLLSNFRTNPICILWGGETTVNVRGKGRGGRNQEMVLAYAAEMLDLEDLSAVSRFGSSLQNGFAFCSFGTDGQDGPTDAAGAIVTELDLVGVQPSERMLMRTYLMNNDSYSFFQMWKAGQRHIKCSYTGTNVMDVQILFVDKHN